MIVAAADYPLLQVFWTILIFFSWVAWIWIVVTVLIDVYRRQDLSGWGKAGWTVLIIVLPFIGVLVYLIAHGSEMADRNAQHSRQTQAQFDDYVRSVAPSGGPATEIAKAKDLLDNGSISAAEFDQIKARALA